MRDAIDVLVVGLGAAGAATVWRLAERGYAVTGVDRYEPPHCRGATHGRTRIVRTTSFESDDYVSWGSRSLVLWRELEKASGQRVVHPSGLLLLGEPGSPIVESALSQADKFKLDVSRLDHDEVCRTYPYLRVADGTVAVREHDAGLVSPELAVRIMLSRAEDGGARIQAPRTVISIDTGADVAIVRFRDGDLVRARHVVLTAGAWLGEIEARSRSMSVQRMVVPWFERAASVTTVPALPPFIHHRGESETAMGGMPGLPGDPQYKVMALAATDVSGVGAADRAVPPWQLSKVEDYVRGHHLYLDPRSVGGQVCVTLTAADGHPIVGPHPRRPNVTLIGAMSGHGFKFAPAFAEFVADQMDGGSAAGGDVFRPDRFNGWGDNSRPLQLDLSLENT